MELLQRKDKDKNRAKPQLQDSKAPATKYFKLSEPSSSSTCSSACAVAVPVAGCSGLVHTDDAAKIWMRCD